MDNKCKDPVFGDMIYKHRWQKIETIKMFEREWNITVVAKAYSNKPISVEQQNSYESYKNNEDKTMQRLSAKIAEYVELFSSELESEGIKVLSLKDLSKVVKPKTLLFRQDGTAIMLLDFVLDEEHGIGIDLDSLEIGNQDLFL